MERFLSEFSESAQKFTYMERPKGTPQQQADLAVDAMARLCLPIQDGEDIGAEDASLLEDAIFGSFLGSAPEFRDTIKHSIATRADRAKAYA